MAEGRGGPQGRHEEAPADHERPAGRADSAGRDRRGSQPDHRGAAGAGGEPVRRPGAHRAGHEDCQGAERGGHEGAVRQAVGERGAGGRARQGARPQGLGQALVEAGGDGAGWRRCRGGRGGGV